MLLKFAKTHKPEDASYFKKLRNNKKGIGPKYQTMYREWILEGYDITPLMHSWMDAHVDVEAEIKLQLESGSPALIDKANPEYEPKEPTTAEMKDEKTRAKFLDKMEALKMAMEDEVLRTETFQDAMLEEANQLALQVWQELLEKDADTIRQMGNILVTHIIHMADDLSRLVAKEQD